MGCNVRNVERSVEDDLAEEFQRHRPRLLGVAYRLLGSAWDAEDVVEEAALR
jgi:RNA polymerase sigma-70 factor (ECF subfamily)